MEKLSGDTAALVAAALTQAEAAMRGGVLAGRKPGSPTGGNVRTATEAIYQHYLAAMLAGEFVRPAPEGEAGG